MPASSRSISLLALVTSASRHHSHVPHWLIHLGLPGLVLVSALDAAIIPLPLPGSADLLLLLLCAQHDSHPIVLAAACMVASVLGGYTTWSAGRKGGEAILHHFLPGRMIEPVNRWVKGHGAAAIAVSAIAPPPVPLMPLLLGAGAFGATRRQFLLAFSLARGTRYGLVAWVGATYGRHVLRLWNKYLADWSGPILWTFFGLLLLAIVFGVWQYRRQMRSFRSGDGASKDGASGDGASGDGASGDGASGEGGQDQQTPGPQADSS
jgi:membrane protein YqaA with SNARE-associated domain